MTQYTLYTLTLFAHLCGVIGVFSGLAVWVFGVVGMRGAQRVEQVRLQCALMLAAGNLVVGSIIVLGAAGLYMAFTVWGERAPWIIVATVSFALLAPGGVFVIDPRVRAIARQARDTPDGPLPESLAARTRDPLLVSGLSVYVGCLFGIVFLMTNKPPLSASVVALLVAVAVGLLASLPARWSAAIERRHEVKSPTFK